MTFTNFRSGEEVLSKERKQVKDKLRNKITKLHQGYKSNCKETATEWNMVVKWAERPNSAVAVGLSQVLWFQLPQADLNPKTQTVCG